MNHELKLELRSVDEAGFTQDVKVVASTTVMSLHFLRQLSRDLGKPMEELNAADVIDALRAANEQQRLASDEAGRTLPPDAVGHD